MQNTQGHLAARQGVYPTIMLILSLQAELRKRADEEIGKRESEFKEMLDQMERDYSQKEQVGRGEAERQPSTVTVNSST